MPYDNDSTIVFNDGTKIYGTLTHYYCEPNYELVLDIRRAYLSIGNVDFFVDDITTRFRLCPSLYSKDVFWALLELHYKDTLPQLMVDAIFDFIANTPITETLTLIETVQEVEDNK